MESPAEFFEHRRQVIAENLTLRCRELGINQSQLARKLGMEHKYVWRWFAGQYAPSERNLRRLEKLLDVPHGYFTAEHSAENAA